MPPPPTPRVMYYLHSCLTAELLSHGCSFICSTSAPTYSGLSSFQRRRAAEPQRNTGQGAVHCYETEKEVPCGNYGFSKESAGGSDESVLLCGRWFGIGNKCGRRQTISLIRRNCCCTSCILMEALNGNGSISYLGENAFL